MVSYISKDEKKGSVARFGKVGRDEAETAKTRNPTRAEIYTKKKVKPIRFSSKRHYPKLF